MSDPSSPHDLPAVPGPDAESEPVLSAGAVVAAVTAVLVLLVSFGVPLSDGQQSAILGVFAVVTPIVLAMWARRKAWAPATVARVVAVERYNAMRGQP